MAGWKLIKFFMDVTPYSYCRLICYAFHVAFTEVATFYIELCTFKNNVISCTK
jgi:hypothetical protein